MAGPMCWQANSTAVTDESAERTHVDLGKDFVSESLSREAQPRELKKKVGGRRQGNSVGWGTPESRWTFCTQKHSVKASRLGTLEERRRDRHQDRLQRLGFIVQFSSLVRCRKLWWYYTW